MVISLLSITPPDTSESHPWPATNRVPSQALSHHLHRSHFVPIRWLYPENTPPERGGEVALLLISRNPPSSAMSSTAPNPPVYFKGDFMLRPSKIKSEASGFGECIFGNGGWEIMLYKEAGNKYFVSLRFALHSSPWGFIEPSRQCGCSISNHAQGRSRRHCHRAGCRGVRDGVDI